MDNFDLEHFNQSGGDAAGHPQTEKPIPFDNGDSQSSAISRKPLSLGGASSATPQVSTKKATSPATPATKPAPSTNTQASHPVAGKPATQAVAAANPGNVSGYITGCKTFFAKLHAGAIEFLDEQITGWLEKNPHISIKQTNVTVGEIQAKKTEPNLIVMVWF